MKIVKTIRGGLESLIPGFIIREHFNYNSSSNELRASLDRLRKTYSRTMKEDPNATFEDFQAMDRLNEHIKKMDAVDKKDAKSRYWKFMGINTIFDIVSSYFILTGAYTAIKGEIELPEALMIGSSVVARYMVFDILRKGKEHNIIIANEALLKEEGLIKKE